MSDIGYRRTGIAALLSTQDAADMAQGWLKATTGMLGVDSRMLGAAETAAIAKGSTDKYVAALLSPSDAYAEPQLAAPAIAEQIRRKGGKVLQHCAVRGIETTAGRISGVVTEKGAIKCSSVVLAGGVWSPVFARSLGIDLPQFMAFTCATRFKGGAGPELPVISDVRNLVMRPTMGGGYDVAIPIAVAPITPQSISNIFRLMPAMRAMWSSINPGFNFSTFIDQWRMPHRWALDQPSPFEANRILVPEIRKSITDKAVSEMKGGFPTVAASGIIDQWAGALTSTPDNMPVISAAGAVPGLFVGSGFYFGLTMAPAAGEALADLVMGHKPTIDLSLYRFSRFSDGTPITFRE